MLRGKVKYNQLDKGILIFIFKNSFVKRGLSKNIPKKEANKSNIAYSKIRKERRYSMDIIRVYSEMSLEWNSNP